MLALRVIRRDATFRSLTAQNGHRRQSRASGAHRADARQDRLDRPLHRPASALRDARQRRAGRSAEIFAGGVKAGRRDFGKQYLGRGLSWLRV